MAETKKTESTEMTVSRGYGELTNMSFLSEAMNDECAGLEFSFDRVKIPSGGMTAFEVPTGDGETTELEKDIECVILLSHPNNSYYHEAYRGGSNPPDCGSTDGITGIGTPGGLCKNCPLNQFGSGAGKSKACKNKRTMYLLRENEIFPLMLILPPGSLKSFSKYVQSLLTRGKRPHQVVTRISLRKTKNDDNPEFSQAVFQCVRVLDDKEQANIDTMIGFVREFDSRLSATFMTPVEDADNPFVDPVTGEIIEPLK